MNLTGATPLGALAGSTPLHLVVGLALRDGTQQPTAAQAQSVAGYLTSQGFTGVTIAKNDLMVSATATAAQASSAFDTSLESYALNGRTVYTNTQPAQVPASLGGTVVAVLGLATPRRMPSARRRAT